MPVGVQLEFTGASLEQYDRAHVKMGTPPGGAGPAGLVFHWVTKTDAGFRATDVWDSRETFEKFVAEQLGPISQEVGLPRPEVHFFEVHNYLTAGS